MKYSESVSYINMYLNFFERNVYLIDMFNDQCVSEYVYGGSLRVVGEEISKYKLDLVGVQEVRWDGGGTEPAGEYIFPMERGIEIMN
jgi:hypothetical protein